ncbi:MAG: hypothetical protein JO157_15030 [Acetobacteraceae bacterium]|nr:hypothetical protein [Acetobacteraceae bacterium]
MRPHDEAVWRRLRGRAWSEGARAPEWPAGVHALSDEGLRLLGLDGKGQLYWDGKPLEVRRRPGLTWRQKLVAGAVTAAAIAGGVNGTVQAVSAGTEYGCKHGWWTAGCAPRTIEAAPDGRR